MLFVGSRYILNYGCKWTARFIQFYLFQWQVQPSPRNTGQRFSQTIFWHSKVTSRCPFLHTWSMDLRIDAAPFRTTAGVHDSTWQCQHAVKVNFPLRDSELHFLNRDEHPRPPSLVYSWSAWKLSQKKDFSLRPALRPPDFPLGAGVSVTAPLPEWLTGLIKEPSWTQSSFECSILGKKSPWDQSCQGSTQTRSHPSFTVEKAQGGLFPDI